MPFNFPARLKLILKQSTTTESLFSEYVAGRYENVTVSFSKMDLQDVRNPFGVGNAFLYDINNSGSMVAGGGSAGNTPAGGLR
jgi:hypothetical protein